jgi:hypothetical protein
MLIMSLFRNAPAILSLTISMVAGDNPPTLWSKGMGFRLLLCCSLAHVLGFCGALMLALGAPYWSLYFSGFLGPKRLIPMRCLNYSMILRQRDAMLGWV